MASEKTKIGIIGMGPVGSILAAHLAESGEDVVAEDISRKLLSEIGEKGLRITGITQVAARIDKTVNSISELSKFDPLIIFIATKAYALRKILPEIKQIYTPATKIVSFQNGLDNERYIAERLGIDTTYRVVINYAGNMTSPGNVRVNWFQPPNYVGAWHKGKYGTDETTKHIANIMTTSGLKTEETPDIKRYVWKKTILNSALCSICAITGQTMKEAIELEHTCSLAVKMLEEGLQVAKADGYDFGPEALAQFTSYLEKGGAHKPSMLVDVENERPTEVDFMSGAIVRYREAYQIPAPVNSTFTHLLKALEKQYSKH